MFHLYAKWAMRSLGVEPKIIKHNIPTSIEGALFVSNHVSYLDMPLLASLYPVTFVSTVEFKQIGFFGHFASLLNCIIIERRSFAKLKNEISQIEAALYQGENVLFFPESRATDGMNILPFKRPFFIPAELKNRDVIAYTIQYESINGENITLQNKDKIYWYWQTPLFKHILKLIESKKIAVTIYMELIRAKDYSFDGDGVKLAQVARQVVLKNWRPLSNKNHIASSSS